MPKVRPSGHPLGVRLDHHCQRVASQAEAVAHMIDEAQRSPAWPDIAEGFMALSRAGIPRDDPAVVLRVIEQGEWLYRELEDRIPTQRGYSHEPVIYYFGLGDLVKIGITRHLPSRADALNPQFIYALERGTFADEKARHELFHQLNVHGEWFRNEDPLTAYIAATAAAFESDFGQPLSDWLTAHGMSSRA